MNHEKNPDEMQSEYDIRGGIRGKYYQRYRQGTNVVVLEADVAAVFPGSESVNEALRLFIGQPEFAIRRVLHQGSMISLAIDLSSAALDVGDMLVVVDTVDGLALGEFEVTELGTGIGRARAIEMDALWAGQILASDQHDLAPPLGAVAARMPRVRAA